MTLRLTNDHPADHPGLGIMSIALGGCIRAEPVAYGITEDTGGHITYLLGAMEALAARGDVAQAEIVTRLIDDTALGPDYAVPSETVAPGLTITRIDSGERAYLAKEALAADRSAFVAALIAELEARDRLPDIVHAHFADAADVARALRERFGIPFVYTAHSLGIDKQRAFDGEPCPALAARIAEEGRAIAGADAVIGSSRDECERQLTAYDGAAPERIERLRPGIAQLQATAGEIDAARALIAPFLRVPGKPIVLAIARPVRKKNLAGLIEAFGAHPTLRDRANLVVLAGLRRSIEQGEPEQVEVMRGIADAIDRHDLHGAVAWPARHERAEVRGLYALARESGGVFVNPALIEPYGLTIVEAAVHGVPVVATRAGGPTDIVGELAHGLLIDPEDRVAIGGAIDRLIGDRALWRRCSAAGRAGSAAMDWNAYAAGFVAIARRITGRAPARVDPFALLLSDIDNTLTGCRDGVCELKRPASRAPRSRIRGRHRPLAQRGATRSARVGSSRAERAGDLGRNRDLLAARRRAGRRRILRRHDRAGVESGRGRACIGGDRRTEAAARDRTARFQAQLVSSTDPSLSARSNERSAKRESRRAWCSRMATCSTSCRPTRAREPRWRTSRARSASVGSA